MNMIKIDATHVKPFIADGEMTAMQARISEAKDTLLNKTGAGNDFLGWVDLPSTFDNKIVERLKNDVKRLSDKIQAFVVIGIGGSYLGARAVIESLQSELSPLLPGKKSPVIIYAGHTLSEDYYADLLKLLDNMDYAVAVISKSGTTTEPAIAFRIIKNHLESKYGVTEARERIIAITDEAKGALHDISVSEKYPMYVIPNNIGGRYSVLTPVGLLPIAMAGYDIDQLLAGAREMRDICINNKFEDNPALTYAALRNILYNKGKKVEMLVNFEPRLKYISEWWKQLYGESEGKEGLGILPHSLSFTTDLHSMGQYVQEGERLLFETLIHVDNAQSHVGIPSDKENLDGINYLVTKSLNDINHCAEEGTVIAHERGGVPVIRICIPSLTERTIGQLLYFFEFACGVSGYTLKINPFDQPGVEAYKKNMFILLGKPGYEGMVL